MRKNYLGALAAVFFVLVTGGAAVARDDVLYHVVKRIRLSKVFATKTPQSLVVYQPKRVDSPSMDSDPDGVDAPVRLCFVGGPRARATCTETKNFIRKYKFFEYESIFDDASIARVQVMPPIKKFLTNFYGRVDFVREKS